MDSAQLSVVKVQLFSDESLIVLDLLLVEDKSAHAISIRLFA